MANDTDYGLAWRQYGQRTLIQLFRQHGRLKQAVSVNTTCQGDA